jgi:hydroxymethylglutaryl-CoA lyase
MATPPIVRRAVKYLQDTLPELPIGLHFHNTRGLGLVNVMAGLDEGIDQFDASFGGIGGCPFAPKATGNICTEDLVYMLHEMNIDTGIDHFVQHVDQIFGTDIAGRFGSERAAPDSTK